MRSRLSLGFVLVLLSLGVTFGAYPVFAQSFSFPVGGFTSTNVCANSSSPASTCQVLTNGSPSRPQVVTGGILRLTSANLNQHASAWFAQQQPLATGFTTTFQFRISNTNLCFFCTFPADGMALVIQNDPAGTGAIGYTGNGQNMAYGNNDVSTASGPGEAILNSLAVELDTHQNTNYSDPDGNHIAVQSCGPNNASTLSPNSADHDYVCPNGSLAKLALESLPSGLSLTDGNIHTITVNYLPPGTCTSGCNNLSVYFDSTLILQTTLNIAQQLNLTGGSTAYIGLTAATGSLVENNDIVSWSFSQWPLAPITIIQPVQPTATNFSYTSNLNAVTDYSQSGLPASSFQGLFMQGSVQTITDQQFSDLVNNTSFQGSTCQHQDTGNGNYSCVVTTDLCTTPSNSTPAGTNCLSTGTNPLIKVSNSYNLDPSQEPIVAPGYIMGKDTALSCGASADNTCKGLVSIFTSISGDKVGSIGNTDNFNSILIPILGSVQPSTSVTTTPPLNSGWTNGSFTLNFSSVETVPRNNTNPPSTLPTISSINYSVTGANLPSPASGTISGATGSVSVPVTVAGSTVFTYAATDSSNIIETLITNSGGTVSSASPTFTINVDLTPPTVTCTPPAVAWQAADVLVPCTASDNPGGSGLVGSSSFSVSTNVPAGTETNAALTVPPFVTVKDIAGNTSAPQPPQGNFGPFDVDKKPPVITGPSISPASPTYGQTVTANYSCTDGGSGVVQCGPSGSPTFAATASTGPLNSPAPSSTGPQTFTVVAQDAVGNQSTPSSVSYTVAQATPTISWPAPAAITYGTPLSATQLDATASVTGTFVYTPAAGTVLTAGNQPLSVTFTPTDTTDYTTAPGNTSLLVNQAKPTVTWAAPAPITYGTALSATQLNASANVPGTFAYNPTAGTVLGAGSQTLSVTFTPTDTTDYTSVTTTVGLTVNQATPTVTWSAPAAITYGTPLSSTQLDATANVPGTFVYTPAAGTVLTAGNQPLSATFTPTDTTDYTTAPASATLMVNQAKPTISWVSPAPITYGTALSSTQLDATASVPGTFAYSPGAGTVLTAANQNLSVTFTPSDTADYTSASASTTLVVGQAKPTVTWAAPAPITYGTALSSTQLDATASVPGTFSYNPAAGTVLTAGNQTLTATFTPTDTTDYTSAAANTTLVVGQAKPTVTWTAPAPITYGTPLSSTQLDATANVPGTFAYSPGAGTVLGAGNHNLSVTFTPTDTTDYTSATASTTLVIGQAKPTVAWTTPAPITYGTALSSTQLDATASVPGTFVYTPAAGTVLAAGTQTLSVTFTPTDTVDYTTASAQVSLLVTQPLISFSPSSIAFGSVKDGSSETITVAVSNPGTASLKITKIAFATPNEDDDEFTITNNCTSAVAPGGKCSFSVKFSPYEIESYNFTLNVTDNAPGSPQQIPLTATGVKKQK